MVLPDPPGGVPLSESEWQAITALQEQLDLEGPDRPAPESGIVSFARRFADWLRWLLDPKAEGQPMPSLLRRRRSGRGRQPTERPLGA
jgi:hypothetical protein